MLGGKAADIASSIGNVVDKFVQTKDEKDAINIEIQKEVNRHLEAVSVQANQELEAYLKDLDSARNMQIEALKQEDKFSKRFVYYLAIGVILMTFIFNMCFFFIQYPERNHDIINMIAGTLNSTGFAAIIYFFFGSSKSSQNKQDTLDRIKK